MITWWLRDDYVMITWWLRKFFVIVIKLLLFNELPGTHPARRQALVNKMNSEYSKALCQDYSQEEAYKRFVNKFSYRLLDGFTYEKNPTPFRSDRCAIPPPETEGSVTGTNLLDLETQSNSEVILLKF